MKGPLPGLFLIVFLMSPAYSAGGNMPPNANGENGAETMSFELKSTAFEANKTIPQKHSCEGSDVSPALEWGEVPSGTATLALIADDPDAPAGTWVHWVIYDLPASLKGLKEGIPAVETLDNGAKQGVNDFRRVGYGGPCPPPGNPHRYFFKLYALDRKLGLPSRATKQQVVNAMKGHILAEGELVGLYKR